MMPAFFLSVCPLAACLAVAAPAESEPPAPSPPTVALPAGGDRSFYAAMLAWTREVPADASPARLAQVLARPVDAGRLTSRFGMRIDPLDGSARGHHGIDIAARYGSPVRAAADGVVVFAGTAGGYGQMIEIDHGEGLLTRYGHLSGLLVWPGTPVHRGASVGLVGSSGRSTGAHVHFEVRRNGRPVDPGLAVEGDGAPGWGRVAPLPPVEPHWQGWRTSPERLPSAF